MMSCRQEGATHAANRAVVSAITRAEASSTRLTLLGVIAVAAIFLILMADFGSTRVATLVFLTLPFALVGAIVAVLLTGGVLSLGYGRSALSSTEEMI